MNPSVGGGDEGRDGGSGGDTVSGNVGPLVVGLVVGLAATGIAATGISGELVAGNAGLLLSLGLATRFDLALVKAALDAESEIIRDLC